MGYDDFDIVGTVFGSGMSAGPDGPAEYRTKLDVYLCRSCGAVVGERLQHVAWHKALDSDGETDG